MRALVWITEDSWEATIAAAAAVVPPEAEVTLLHVTGAGAEALARGARSGLLGRARGPEGPPEPMRSTSEAAARALLADAAALLGRSAEQVALRGRPEQERGQPRVPAAVLTTNPRAPRDRGPGASRAPRADHVTCRVLHV